MTFSAALAADLHALSAAIDDHDVDIADTVAQLSDTVASTVDSYPGMCVTVAATATQPTAGETGWQLSTVRAGTALVGSSVTIPVSAATASVPFAQRFTLVLYAGMPGAFIDLAADLAWMTGRDLAEFDVDQHLSAPQPAAESMSMVVMSSINQAIGVLIGAGRTPKQAERDLLALAVPHRGGLPGAAAAVSDTVTRSGTPSAADTSAAVAVDRADIGEDGAGASRPV